MPASSTVSAGTSVASAGSTFTPGAGFVAHPARNRAPRKANRTVLLPGRRFHPAHHANQIAAVNLADIGRRIALLEQRTREIRKLRYVLEPLWSARDAVEIA